jgi:exosome complex component CSL4
MVKTGEFVVPGDFLATAEEFVPGEGAYEEGGKIYSSSTGVVLIDVRTKHISVFSRVSTPPVLKRGDVVIGRIEEVKDQIVSVHIDVLRGREDRELPFPNVGAIHISQVRSGFVKDLKHEFKAGDIVRAKVLNMHKEIAQLTTEGKDFGVIVANCSRCRSLLKREGRKLKCSNCGNTESRKLASDYRRGVL